MSSDPDRPTVKFQENHTLTNLRATSRKLSNLHEKNMRKQSRRNTGKASTLIQILPRKSREINEESIQIMKKHCSACNLARLFSLKNDNEKYVNPKERIREYVKYALYGLRNPYQAMPLKNFKRGNSLGPAKKLALVKNPDDIVKKWSEELTQKKKKISRKQEKNIKESISSFSSLDSDEKEKNGQNSPIKEKEVGSKLSISTISQKSRVFDKFGTVSNFLTKIFSKDNLKTAKLKSNNTDFSQSDCAYYKTLRNRQKEALMKEIEIIYEDQSRLNLSKPLLEKWLRAKQRVKFAIRVQTFNYDIKIFGSTANVGTEIPNDKNFMSKIFVRQETLIKKTLNKEENSKKDIFTRGIIFPGSSFMSYWSLFVIFLLFYTATITIIE